MPDSGIHGSWMLLRMLQMSSEPRCDGGQRQATQFPANQEAGWAQGLQQSTQITMAGQDPDRNFWTRLGEFPATRCLD